MRYLAFVLVGLMTPAVGEFQYSVLIRGDWMNFRGSFAFNLVFLTLVFAIHMGLQAVLRSKRLAYILLGLLTGIAGLCVEWFLIGNSPWGNPLAHQPGMFAFWSCMALVPALVTNGAPGLRPARLGLLGFGILYVALVVAIELGTTGDWAFALHIWSVIIGYMLLWIYCHVAAYIGLGPCLEKQRAVEKKASSDR